MGTVASYHFHANTLVVCNNHGYHKNCQTPYSEEAFDFKRKFQQYRIQQQRRLTRRQKLSTASSASAQSSRLDAAMPGSPSMTSPTVAGTTTAPTKRMATMTTPATKRSGGGGSLTARPATVGGTSLSTSRGAAAATPGTTAATTKKRLATPATTTHCCFNSFFDPACGAWAPGAAQTVFPRSYRNKLQILVFGRDDIGGGFGGGRGKSAEFSTAAGSQKPPLRPLTAMRSEKNRDQFALPGVLR